MRVTPSETLQLIFHLSCPRLLPQERLQLRALRGGSMCKCVVTVPALCAGGCERWGRGTQLTSDLWEGENVLL